MRIALAVIGCLVAGITVTLPAQEVKIATVNIARVLDEYAPYQNELCRQTQERHDFDEERRRQAEWQARLDELPREWEKLRKQANDKSLSKADRQNAGKAMKVIENEAKELDRKLRRRHGRDWGTPEQMFNEHLGRRRWEIVKDVQKSVTAVAERERCGLVLDVSQRTGEGDSGKLLWANAKFPDLTAAVLAELQRRDVVKELYVAVNDAGFFSAGAVNQTGRSPEAESAFRKLLQVPEAVEQCESLMADGTQVGRLYGFLGLRLLGAQPDAGYEARLKRNRTTVGFMKERALSKVRVSELAKQIAAGKLK